MSATENNPTEGLSWGCALGAAVLVVGIMLLVRLDNPPMEWFESDPKASRPVEQTAAAPTNGLRRTQRCRKNVPG